MRIGLVIYGSLETLSGGYLYDRRLVEYLIRSGDEVVVISMPWSHYAEHLAHNLDPVWMRRFRELKVDVLLQDELNHPSLAWLNGRLRGKVSYPILAIVHHLRGSEAHPSGLLGLYRQVERKYLRSVDGFIFNSHTTRTVVEHSLGTQDLAGVVATPGGDRFGSGLSEMEIRRRFEGTGPANILFLGNLIRRKGLDVLLGGLAQLRGLDWRLRIVGRMDVDPHYSAEVQALADKKGLSRQVEFLGRLEEAQLESELRSAHILAVPSQYEGFGIVYLEGMSFGLPGLASRAGAAGEIIRDGESGWLVRPGDPGQITRSLGEIIHDRPRLLKMSLAARRRFLDFPGWEESAASIRTYLTGLI